MLGVKRVPKYCIRCGTKNNKKFDTKNEKNCLGRFRKHIFIRDEGELNSLLDKIGIKKR